MDVVGAKVVLSRDIWARRHLTPREMCSFLYILYLYIIKKMYYRTVIQVELDGARG